MPIMFRERVSSAASISTLVILLLVSLTVACGAWPVLGDPGYYVEYRNLTGRNLTLYVMGERDGPPDVAPFRQDAVSGSLWRYPRDDSDRRRVTVLAIDAANVLVYCAHFDRPQIRALNYRVDVVTGTNTCRQ